MTVFDKLVEALRDASRYNKNDQVAPAAVLWTDKGRLWEKLIPRLREVLPVLTLGDYRPQALTGPAIWLRCMIAGTLPEPRLPEGVPILYLPGVSRQELRAIEDCPKALQPLAELQYRGVFFTQRNARDWTPAAFLQAGLNVRVADDGATKDALVRALGQVVDEPVERLRIQAPLRAEFFNGLLTPDPVRQLLGWLNDPEGTKKSAEEISKETWAAFLEVCRRDYGFDPESDGAVMAAAKLGKREGTWSTVWERFAEAPQRYGQLPALLRRARPSQSSMFDLSETWPQNNEDEEARLCQDLLELRNHSGAEARVKLAALEEEHGRRRRWVWRELSMAPLAVALEPLARLLELTTTPIGTGTPREIAQRYADAGWQADGAALEALASVSSPAHLDAVGAALEAVYRPWVEDGTTSFQQAVGAHGLARPEASSAPSSGKCLLFSDGLRYDVAMKLKEALEARGLAVTSAWRFGAVPGVTATAKPAISPVAAKLEPGEAFNAAIGGTTVNASVLRRELAQAGFAVLQGNDLGDPEGAAWAEYGNLDGFGHNEGWKLSHRVAHEVQRIAERVAELTAAGWREVEVITDHGWLLLPGGFPTASLPQHLTEVRKGRCARMKEGSSTHYQTVPWHFDNQVQIAVAPGISTFVAGKEYEHGGLSVQECVLPVLTVTAAEEAAPAVEIADMSWSGLRCRVELKGTVSGVRIDLRKKAADPGSSVVLDQEPKAVTEGGKASLVVPDDELEGTAVHLVVLDEQGTVLIQRTTTVGG